MSEKDREVLLAQAIAKALKEYDTVGEKGAYAHTHTGVTLHGPSGIFSTFGLEREIISAHITPSGLATRLPLFPSMDTDPRFGSVTGVTASDGNQPEDACNACPHAYLKGCNLTARFGQICYDTNTIEFNKVISRYNRGDFMDLMFLGSMLGDDSARAGLIPPDIQPGDFLNIVTLAEMLVVGVQFEREIGRQLWQGNIGLTNEFPGLDYQIATGQLDADIPGRLCAGLDSDVKDFGFSDVAGTARDIVDYLASMAWYLQFNAQRMKLAPVKWVVVMTPNLWFELSAVWPCRYMTNRCTDNTGTQVAVINDQTNVTLRDRMRDTMQIPINGKWYDVLTDDGIFEHDAANNANLVPGQFASSIYMVPLTILNNFPVTYRQYLDYRSPVALATVAPFAAKRSPDFWSDNGIFTWTYDGQRWCFLLGAKTEQRVILRTPQLAGRIDHVMYTPTQHLRSPYPDSDYFADGGTSLRGSPRTTYAVWAPDGLTN